MKQFILSLLILFFTSCSAGAQWKKIFLRTTMGYHAVSSELDEVDPFEGLGKYGAHNLFDKDGSTAWVEGAEGSGIGESVYIGAGNRIPDLVCFSNGYQKNRDIFMKNNRVKTLKVSLFVGYLIPGDETEIEAVCRIIQFGTEKTIGLDDLMGAQMIEFPFNKEEADAFKEENLKRFLADFNHEIKDITRFSSGSDTLPKAQYILLFEIADVYKGSRWDDTCISDIWFESKGITINAIPPDEAITEVFEDMEGRMIYVNTNKRERIVLVDGEDLEKARGLDEGEHLDVTLMDVSHDKEWAQIDYLYTQDGAGRVEEYSTLYSVRYLSLIDDPILGIIYGAFGFTEENGKTYLDTADGLVDLEKVLEEFLKQNEKRIQNH